MRRLLSLKRGRGAPTTKSAKAATPPLPTRRRERILCLGSLNLVARGIRSGTPGRHNPGLVRFLKRSSGRDVEDNVESMLRSTLLCSVLPILQVAEGAKIIAARMPEPFDVRKGHEETFKKVSQHHLSPQTQQQRAPFFARHAYLPTCLPTCEQLTWPRHRSQKLPFTQQLHSRLLKISGTLVRLPRPSS